MMRKRYALIFLLTLVLFSSFVVGKPNPGHDWNEMDDTPLKVDTNNGRVGIGTTEPNAKLTIGNNVATGFLDNYNEYQAMLWDSGADAGASYGLGIKGSTMVFNSGGGAYSFDRGGAATAMAIDTSGNVGIGTEPNANYKLDVVGKIYASGDICTALSGEKCLSNQGAGGGGVGGSGTPTYIPKWTADTTLGNSVISESSGNVGIGGAPGDALLKVTLPQYNQLQSLWLEQRGSNLVVRSPGEGSDQTIIENTVGQLILNPNGYNIGIGTMTPEAKLEVKIPLYNLLTSLKLEHRGSNLIVRSPSTSSTQTIIENTAGQLILNPNEFNVGIGTMIPEAKLDVNGNVKVRGSITLNAGGTVTATNIVASVVQAPTLTGTADNANNGPSGSWCGLSQGTALVFSCKGHNPFDSCPSGYTRRIWQETGGGLRFWVTCAKN